MNKIRTRRQIDFWHENGCLRVIPAPRRAAGARSR